MCGRNKLIVLAVWLSWLCLGIAVVDGDLFTSIASLDDLQKKDALAGSVLRPHMDSIEKNGYTDPESMKVKRMYEGFTQNETNVRHPIDAYHLLKRWYHLTSIYGEKHHMKEMMKLREIPTESDLKGAAAGILRLQRTYNLKTEDLAKGQVAGHQSVQPLDVDDVYALGERALLLADYGLGAQWMELAVTKADEILQKHEDELNEAKKELQEEEESQAQGELQEEAQDKGDEPKHAEAEGKEEQPQESLADHEDPGDHEDPEDLEDHEDPEDLEVEDSHNFLPFKLIDAYFHLVEAYSELKDYPSLLKALHAVKELDTTISDDDFQSEVDRIKLEEEKNANITTWKTAVDPEYTQLCRGESIGKVPKIKLPLTCRYKKSRLLPYVQYKEETLSWDPRISMFYDVIAEPEIEHIKQLAQPILLRAEVAGAVYNVSDQRISKVAWLEDFDSPDHPNGSFVQGISRRVGDITDMDVRSNLIRSNAEPFQVVNYGIGGQYDPHWDYLGPVDIAQDAIDNPHMIGSGNRIVTFMFYLSDVTEGGATVFPNVGVRVPAIKGAAAFWYNVYPTQEQDHYTLHAGCPVLIGEKWVANKWILSAPQMFRFPCPANQDARWT